MTSVLGSKFGPEFGASDDEREVLIGNDFGPKQTNKQTPFLHLVPSDVTVVVIVVVVVVNDVVNVVVVVDDFDVVVVVAVVVVVVVVIDVIIVVVVVFIFMVVVVIVVVVIAVVVDVVRHETAPKLPLRLRLIKKRL